MMSPTTLCLLTFAAFAAPVDTVAVEVDASSIKPEGPGISRQLGGKVEDALSKRGIAIDDASTNRLRIEVRQPSFISYDVTFVLTVDGAVVEPGLEMVTCERCPLARMDGAVVAKLPEAIALMEQASEAKAAAEATVEEPGPEEAGPGDEVAVVEPAEERLAQAETKPPRWRIMGPLGISGIVVGTGGVIMVAAGVVQAAQPPKVEQDAAAHESDIAHDPDRTGRFLLGAGIATSVVGGVLLAVDLTVLRRKRREGTRTTTVAPGLGSIMIKGRF